MMIYSRLSRRKQGSFMHNKTENLHAEAVKADTVYPDIPDRFCHFNLLYNIETLEKLETQYYHSHSLHFNNYKKYTFYSRNRSSRVKIAY